MSQVFQIHATALDTICWHAYELRVIEKRRKPPSLPGLVGTAVHRTVHLDLEHKRGEGALLSDEAVGDFAASHLRQAWDRDGVMLAGEDAAAGARQSKEKATDKSVRLAKLHHAKAAPEIEPVHIERPFVLDIKGEPFQIVGRLDVQTADTIRDAKTRNRSPNSDEARASLQLTAYALGAQKQDGVLPRSGHLDVLVDKREPARVDVSRIFDAENDFPPFLARVQQVISMLKAGLFPPVGSSHWKCSANYCEYFGECRYALRPVSISLVQINPAQPEPTKEQTYGE